METLFGDYITKEYGILKQILSCLQPCDLRNAKLVCKAWKSAVESLLDKNPCWMISDCEPLNSVRTLLPALIVQHPYCHVWPKKCKLCKNTSYLCPTTLSDHDTVFISFDSRCQIYSPGDSAAGYMFWKTAHAFMIPSSEKIQVSTFYTSTKTSIFKEPITEDVVRRCTGGEDPIKCLLVISRTGWGSKKAKWINQLLNHIVNKQGVTFAVGGGDIRSVFCKKGFSEERWEKPGLIIVTIRGENVTAHSDILSGFGKQRTEDFVQEMGRRVGPLPEDHSRVAFIAQCVDRTESSIEMCESSVFTKTFPSVPQFGFRAYGEYGIRSNSSGEHKHRDSSKRMKITFDHAHTTSFVVLTFKKV